MASIAILWREQAHPFLRKWSLFAGGRWPLGLYDDCFALF